MKNYRALTQKTSGESVLAKRMMLFAIVFALCLFGVAYFFKPPTFVECKKGELEPRCVCPANESYIGKRNIIFVDITDKIPEGKIEDLYRLIKETAFVEQGFWSWITGGKKIEKTSIYLLSDQKPAEMTPVASYCSFPPNTTWLLTDLSATEEKRVKDVALVHVKKAVDDILQRWDAGRSHIVEALVTVTSNATYWKAGSKLIVFSDLYENSDTCGFLKAATSLHLAKRVPLAKNGPIY